MFHSSNLKRKREKNGKNRIVQSKSIKIVEEKFDTYVGIL